MIVGSDQWTGAKGISWHDTKPVQRSKFLRWWLLTILLAFAAMFVALLLGSLTFLWKFSVGAPMAGFIAGMWISGWGSPFRNRWPSFWNRGKKRKLGSQAPDEFEIAIYGQAKLTANRITTFLMFAVFIWLGISVAADYPPPSDGRVWLMMGLFFLGFCLLLPTVIAEFRTAFPDQGEWDDNS